MVGGYLVLVNNGYLVFGDFCGVCVLMDFFMFGLVLSCVRLVLVWFGNVGGL